MGHKNPYIFCGKLSTLDPKWMRHELLQFGKILRQICMRKKTCCVVLYALFLLFLPRPLRPLRYLHTHWDLTRKNNKIKRVSGAEKGFWPSKVKTILEGEENKYSWQTTTALPTNVEQKAIAFSYGKRLANFFSFFDRKPDDRWEFYDAAICGVGSQGIKNWFWGKVR